MGQVFSERADRRLRRIAAIVLAAFAALFFIGFARSDAGVGAKVPQPIPFSHQQHVHKVGLDCATCHTSALSGAAAGMPTTDTCLTCHADLFRGTDALQPLHEAAARGEPILWRAVTRMSDVARFHHGAHARAGVSCATCHGAVETMSETVKAKPLTMGWCVDCHRGVQDRAQASTIRPVSEWHRDLTDCSVCHY